MSVNSRMQASQFCRLFAKQDCNTPIDITTFGFLKFGTTPTATAAGQADGGGIPLTSSRANALEENADTGSTALGGDYYVSAIKGNLVHGTADTNSSEIGVLGALNNNTATFGSGDKYAVRGHLDLWGITNLTGANVNVGAVSAYVENEAVPVVDSGNVLCGLQAYQVTYKPTVGSGVYPARGMNPALWIRASGAAASWQTGIYMPVNSVETGIRIGNWVGSGAAGSAIPFATAQNVYADGQLDLVAVFGESTSNLTASYSAKCGRFRHIATGSSLTVAHETYGVVGQMCALGATLTHVHGGVLGTFEGSGASVVCNSSYTLGGHGAVVARVGGHTNITATTPLAGFLAFNNGTANLTSGTLSAFAVSVRDTTYPWTYALYVPAGTVSAGISIGTSAAPVSTGTSGTNWVYINAENTEHATGGVTRALFARNYYHYGSAQSTTMGISGVAGIEATGVWSGSSASYLYGVQGQVDLPSGAQLNCTGSSIFAGVRGVITGAHTNTAGASTEVFCLFGENLNNTAMTGNATFALLGLRNDSLTAGMSTVIKINPGNAGCAAFIEFDQLTGAMWDASKTALTGKGGLLVKVGGATYGYIPIVTGS